MKKLLVFIFCFAMVGANAQDSPKSYIKGRLSFQAGICHEVRENYSTRPKEYVDFINVASYYGITNWTEVGAFLGYYSRRPHSNTFSFNPNGAVYSFGLASKHHLLPWVIKQESFRFDLYIPINLGISHHMPLTTYSYRPAYTESFFGTGLGVAGYFTKHIGLFVEYNYKYWFDEGLRTYDKQTKHLVYFGIALKF